MAATEGFHYYVFGSNLFTVSIDNRGGNPNPPPLYTIYICRELAPLMIYITIVIVYFMVMYHAMATQ